MTRYTLTREADATRVTGIPGLDGWEVVIHDSGAITVVPPRGTEIKAVDWRQIPLGAIQRQVSELRAGGIIHALLGGMASTDGDPDTSSRRGPRAHLARVVRIYRLALEHGLRPQAALAEAFDANERTTQRWITNARKAGLLGPYDDEVRQARHGYGLPDEKRKGPATPEQVAPPAGSTPDPTAERRGTGRVRGKNSVPKEGTNR